MLTLLRQPFGQVLLLVIGVGILGYAAYYLAGLVCFGVFQLLHVRYARIACD